MKKLISILFVLCLLNFVPLNSYADEAYSSAKQQLVVDKCPEFCPPTNGWFRQPKVCAQVLLPVPGKPGWWYTDSCKTKMIKAQNSSKR